MRWQGRADDGLSGIDSRRVVATQIASALHMSVRSPGCPMGGAVTSLSELTGMEGDVITLQEIFRFRQTGVSSDGQVLGVFEATGIRPRFMDQLATRGIQLSNDIFRMDARLEE